MGYSSDYESDYACTESENWSPSPAVIPKVRGALFLALGTRMSAQWRRIV